MNSAALFPDLAMRVHRVTLAPPLARRLPARVAGLAAAIPLLRTHLMAIVEVPRQPSGGGVGGAGSVSTPMPSWLQRALAAGLLVVTAPILVALATAVRLTSPGPSLYRARRIGASGEFSLLKFRTMRLGSESHGPGVTASGDVRVTHLGRLLRETKLDELPQLWNVVRGDMLLVGPRPEDPRYVELGRPAPPIRVRRAARHRRADRPRLPPRGSDAGGRGPVDRGSRRSYRTHGG